MTLGSGSFSGISQQLPKNGSRPTAFDVQALIANHFVLLSWKHVGSEQQLKAFREDGEAGGKETNESEPLMKHR